MSFCLKYLQWNCPVKKFSHQSHQNTVGTKFSHMTNTNVAK